jgi:hypothetical protein
MVCFDGWYWRGGMGLKVKLAYWQMRPLTGVSEAYMVELSIQRVSQPGDVLHLLGVFSPENLSEWGYPVFNNVSWLVMPRVTLLGDVQALRGLAAGERELLGNIAGNWEGHHVGSFLLKEDRSRLQEHAEPHATRVAASRPDAARRGTRHDRRGRRVRGGWPR